MKSFIAKILLLSAFTCALPNPSQASVYVMAAGSDQSFDTHMVKLKYAARDASDFAKTMSDAGSVPASAITTQVNARLEDFEASLRSISQKLAADSDKSVSKFIFFFSV